jgi:hypothetical protein
MEQRGRGAPTRRSKISPGTRKSPGDHISRGMEFAKAARTLEISDRTTIQVSQDTKSDLDKIKQEADVKTYDEAIRFLLEERRRLRPSTFGLLAGAGPFVRDEEEDSHRIRS